MTRMEAEYSRHSLPFVVFESIVSIKRRIAFGIPRSILEYTVQFLDVSFGSDRCGLLAVQYLSAL